MRYIPLKENLPPEDWRNRAEELTEQLKTLSEEERKDFIEDNSSIWRELRDFLSSLSHGKCWYSEAKEVYSYYHVDHFRPKSEYWWLAFDWKNYRLAGQVGNISKRDNFKVKRCKATSPNDPIEDEVYYLLDPTEEDDPLLLFFDEEGKAIPSKNEGFNKERAEYTIEILKLNYEPLKEARRKVWIECKNLIEDIKKLSKEFNDNQSSAKKAQIKEKIRQLKKLLKPEQEFTAVIQCCIFVYGDDSLKRLIGG